MKEQTGIERIRIRTEEADIRRLLGRLERETENLPGFRIRFGKDVLQLRFPDTRMADLYRTFLGLVAAGEGEEPAGTVTLVMGDPGDYMEVSGGTRVTACWECRGESGLIRRMRWPDRLLAMDRQGNRQYIVMSSRLEEYVPYWAPFRWEFQWFAMSRGYAFLHSGAAGLDGEGVLVSAVSGCGKSTTVLSCLVDGFDYVSDDYLVMEPETGRAYPLFSCGVLNGDSLARLPELKPWVAGRVPRREDRYIVDLGGYRDRFCPGMKIRAIVHPRVPAAGEAGQAGQVRRDPRQVARTQMLISSAQQNGFGMLQEPEVLHRLFSAVSGLPSYVLTLSPDRAANCRALRGLLEKLKEGKPEKE